MTARDTESALLERCSSVARVPASWAADQREANVFRLAAMVVQSRFPQESATLMQVSERYFATHPDELLSPADVLRQGWIINLPRLRDMLSQQLWGARSV